MRHGGACSSNLAIQTFATRDEQVVAGYAKLMLLVFGAWQDIPFNFI